MSTIQTFTGLEVNPLDLKPEDIDIIDIAHALSMKCRFGGHSATFYSVAEHSIYVARQMFKEIEGQKKVGMQKKHLLLAALLHDAAEAYLADIPSPVKKKLDGFDKIEEKALKVIFTKFGIPANKYHVAMKQIKIPDERLLVTEAAVLLRNPVSFEENGLSPASVEIFSLDQSTARIKFLEEFQVLNEMEL